MGGGVYSTVAISRCIFVDLSYSAFMACTFLQGSNFAPFEEVKVPVSNSAEFFQKSAT